MLKNILLNLLFISIALPFLLSLVWVGFTLGTVYQKKKDDVLGLSVCPKDVVCIIPVTGKQVLFQ